MDTEDKNNGNNLPKNPFGNINPYWIYAVIAIVLLLLNFYLMSDTTNSKIPFDRFKEIARGGDVDNILVIGNQTFVEVYLKKESLESKPDAFKDAAKNRLGLSPHYTFKTGPIESFMDDLKDLRNELPENKQFAVDHIERYNWLGSLLGWVLPFALIIFLWVLLIELKYPSSLYSNRSFSEYGFSPSIKFLKI